MNVSLHHVGIFHKYSDSFENISTIGFQRATQVDNNNMLRNASLEIRRRQSDSKERSCLSSSNRQIWITKKKKNNKNKKNKIWAELEVGSWQTVERIFSTSR